MKKEIPVFFAVDNNYVPFLAVTLESLTKNASKNYEYSIFVLTTKDIAGENQKKILNYNGENFHIQFVSLKSKIARLREQFQIRDYYSVETYNRFFIAEMFPQYDKALYLDCDIIVNGDISELYNTELGDNFVAAVQEHIVLDMDIFGQYVEKTLGVARRNYFNAGILLMNIKKFREEEIERRFIMLMKQFKFRVAQDQDYLNVLCNKKVVKLDRKWNSTACKSYDELPAIVHYNLAFKPWHQTGINYEKEFWAYAEKTEFAAAIKACLANYSDADKQKDASVLETMVKTATEDMNDFNNYWNTLKRADSIKAAFMSFTDFLDDLFDNIAVSVKKFLDSRNSAEGHRVRN